MEEVKRDKLESYLYDRMQVSGNPDGEKMQETIQMCIAEMHRQSPV